MAQLLAIVRLMTKQNSIWSKAFLMPLTIWNCVCHINRTIISLKNVLLFLVLTGSKLGFRLQICYLLLLISNPGRYFSHKILRLKICSVVFLPALNPACSSTIISSALSLFSLTLSMVLFGRLMRPVVL